MKQITYTFITLCLILIAFSCTSEPETAPTNITGRWEIEEASRNGKVTQSLEELFFEFREDGSMQTNLMGTTEEATYSIEKNSILQKGGAQDISYKIEEIKDSTMILSTTLRSFDFRFVLGKAIQEQ